MRRTAFAAPCSMIDIKQDWGDALPMIPALGDVAPWRLAVVLDASDAQARIGLQPAARKIRRGGARARDRHSAGRRHAMGRVSGVARHAHAWRRHLCRADARARAGQYRLRQIPEISGAIVAMDPYHRPRLRDGRRLFLRPVGVQPGDAGVAPAGLVIQALRLCGRARQRLYAVLASCSTSRSQSTQANGEIWTAGEFRRRPRSAARIRCATASSIRKI